MGHQLSSKSGLVPLIDRLNKYPIGLVDNGKLREILSLLFDEQEAFVASRFPLEEATLPELSSSTHIPEDELLPILESLANKGIVADLPYAGTTYYMLLPGLIGFFEITFMKNRADLPMKKLAKLMIEYTHDLSGQADEFFNRDNQLTRSLVYEQSVPTTARIATYESAREIIKKAGIGAASYCYCRHKKEHVGKPCKRGARTENICITLGAGARFLTRRGFAEKKSGAELLDILEYARSLNLTHVTENIRDNPTFICNCCRCCCALLGGVQMGFKNGVAKTSYVATVDPERCDYCGDCLAACNVKAIGLAKGRPFTSRAERFSKIRHDTCLGCGACVPSCEKEAISLMPRKGKKAPARDHDTLYRRMLIERGRFRPFLVSRVQKKARNLWALVKKAGNKTRRPNNLLDI